METLSTDLQLGADRPCTAADDTLIL